MKSRRILAVLAACTAVTFTGCGVVTVVPIGEEASYTGKQEFDSAAESQGDWGAVDALLFSSEVRGYFSPLPGFPFQDRGGVGVFTQPFLGALYQ